MGTKRERERQRKRQREVVMVDGRNRERYMVTEREAKKTEKGEKRETKSWREKR